MDNVEQKMPAYIGCKVVCAMPMSEARFRAEIKGEESDPNREDRPGYLVVYPDGYKSWSPQATFERAYRRVSEEEARLI